MLSDALSYISRPKAMRTVLIQPRDLFGPPERQAELQHCHRMNDMVFGPDVIAPTGRPTFNDLFDLCDPDAINVIANSDIYFTELPPHPKPWEAWALSRWDVDADGNVKLWDHADSQDVWIFHGKPIGIDAPFTMGVPGVDNALAWIIEHSGYNLRNPSRTVKAFHIHNVQWRSYLAEPGGMARGGQKQQRIPPPYKLVKPTAL